MFKGLILFAATLIALVLTGCGFSGGATSLFEPVPQVSVVSYSGSFIESNSTATLFVTVSGTPDNVVTGDVIGPGDISYKQYLYSASSKGGNQGYGIFTFGQSNGPSQPPLPFGEYAVTFTSVVNRSESATIEIALVNTTTLKEGEKPTHAN